MHCLIEQQGGLLSQKLQSSFIVAIRTELQNGTRELLPSSGFRWFLRILTVLHRQLQFIHFDNFCLFVLIVEKLTDVTMWFGRNAGVLSKIYGLIVYS